MTKPSFSESVARLKELRDTGARRSVEVIELAEQIWSEDTQKSGGFSLGALGEDIWAFYEQVAIAALDIGKHDLARKAIERLEQKFPSSPRVMPLHGMLLEAKGELKLAKEFYEAELCKSVDPKASNRGSTGETNVRMRKRLIALHLHHYPLPTDSCTQSGKSVVLDSDTAQFSLQEAVSLLVDYLDTVYSDPEGWIQLAEIYCKLGSYDQALYALEDLILIQPDNTFHILRYAETAYTAGHYELAYKTYLRVIELSEKISEASKGGPARRAAIGLKLCLTKVPKEKCPHAQAVAELLNEELASCYSRDWVPLQAGLRVASEPCRKALKSWLSRT
ncbi:hypothetical protein CROQUDRAFT_662506 [Cronartium quercuum f. sp. fusiforme G11]|uniref:ER membrane protein complex subunit 2 n=1 Tax=Cronartium quercuum f. sp. fusiforme G11 TaxID=708437 RepID=A0A9P6NE00_9BASI|nr:hypothetical protein CROQUDRAFT_662506 [Cronartium quercuum f. sp. fusiforme G11]